MTTPLANHLNFGGMTKYGKDILLGMAEEIPDLNPPHKKMPTSNIHHDSLPAIPLPTHTTGRIHQGVQTTQRSNLLWPLICHPHNGKNRGHIPRTGRNRLSDIQFPMVHGIIPETLSKGPRSSNPQIPQQLSSTQTPPHTYF